MTQADERRSSILAKLRYGFLAGWARVFNKYVISIWLICSALATLTGPFGTYDNRAFDELFIVWSILLAGGVVTAFVTFELCAALFPQLTYKQTNAAFIVVGSIGITIVIESLLELMVNSPSELRPGRFELWLETTAVILIIIAVREMIPTLKEDHSVEAAKVVLPEATLPAHSRLAQRLEIAPGTRIIHVTANGHFVEVHTCQHVRRVRMRFSDAVAELDETVGLTVHRSHWVHRDAIRGWVPSNVKPYVVLENGKQIPISKPHLERVANADLVELTDMQVS
ncbi:LytTR family DNA-binding domain-containing protein [Planktotalea sp.]|uniref:LytTR family DNA-binding domain-containing protein n=1 Tax=Planktotalea sp. TaxID=2029877 RepID=UPI003D6B61A9